MRSKRYSHTNGRDGKYSNNTTYFRGRVHKGDNWTGKNKDQDTPFIYGGDLPIKREKLQEESWQTSALGKLLIRICDKCGLTTITGSLPSTEQNTREPKGELLNA